MNRQKALFWICLLLCGVLIAGASYLIGYKTAYDRMENAAPSTVVMGAQREVIPC